MRQGRTQNTKWGCYCTIIEFWWFTDVPERPFQKLPSIVHLKFGEGLSPTSSPPWVRSCKLLRNWNQSPHPGDEVEVAPAEARLDLGRGGVAGAHCACAKKKKKEEHELEFITIDN